MNLIKPLFTFILCLVGGISQAANNYQDWWWNPAQSGMGLNVGQQNDSIFVAWFNYGDDTKASFLTMGGVLNGNTLTGTLYRGTGPVPGPNYNPAQVKQTAVGTATLTFNSNNDATLTYSFDNKGGTMALQRFSFAIPNLNQSWTVMNTNTNNKCSNPSLNGTTNNLLNLKFQSNGGAQFTAVGTQLDGTNKCIMSMIFQAAGSRGVATGIAACDGGVTANFNFDDLTIQGDYINLSFTATDMSEDRACIQKGYMSGVAQKLLSPSFDFKAAKKSMLLKGISKTFNLTGDCTSTFSRFDSPATRTVWNGQSVYAVANTEIAGTPVPANCALGSAGTYTSVTYYDLDFGELAKLDSDGYYSEYKAAANSASLNALTVGDSGSMGTWQRWNNTSKTSLIDSEVWSFIVEPDSPTSVIFNLVDRSYNNQNSLTNTTQIRYRIFSNGDFEVVSLTADFPNNSGHLVGK